MATVTVNDSNLYDIADSIRAKLGVQTTYKPSQMADAIDSISGGGITPTGTKSITANGTYDVTQYASAEVDVPTGSTPVINSLSVTENGTYTAPTGVDGYSPVTVNVSGGGSGYFELLEEITVSEDIRSVNIDLSDYSDCRDLIIIEDVTLSASDWMYYVINGTSPSGGTYDNSSRTKTGVCFAWFETTTGGNYTNIKPSSNSLNMISGKINNFFIYAYSSSNKILTGSKFQIYGKRG